jgi:HD-GYP domain-containing protein (c-di-GMP phosphodiesterase class II)
MSKDGMSEKMGLSGGAVGRLMELGVALTGERDLGTLLTKVLSVAIDLTGAEGGTIYTVSEDDRNLLFSVAINRPLNIRVGGNFRDKPPEAMNMLPLYLDGGADPNLANVASHAWHLKKTVNLQNVYEASEEGFDVSGVKRFDEVMGYRTRSMIAVPVARGGDRVVCVLQMINRRDADGVSVPFVYFDESEGEARADDQGLLLKGIASQAAVAIENQMLIEGERKLWESLLQMMASLIDKKSAYTGGHCQRVPVLTDMIARAVNEDQVGYFHDYTLTEDDLYELNVAAWLHDIGKVTTPEYVVDKSTKLETIYNRIHEIRMRYEVLYRDYEIAYWKSLSQGGDEGVEREKFESEVNRLREDFAFVGSCNIGGEFLGDDKALRLEEIGREKWERRFDKLVGVTNHERERIAHESHEAGAWEGLLEDSEEDELRIPGIGDTEDRYNLGDLYNLRVAKGTLTDEERLKIQEHVKVTIDVLSSLPLPRHLRNVVEYAGGHHERIDGKGYPNGLTGDQLSIPARMMALADVFEALSASDRPYRPSKTLSQCMKILGFMVEEGHIDKRIYELFVKSKVWYNYACEYLQPDQMDMDDPDGYIASLFSGG